MGRVFAPARTPTSSAPDTQDMFYTTGQAFLKGAIVVPDAATGRIIEGAADPQSILGVALEAPASKPGFSLSHDSQVASRTGNVQEVAVAKANRSTVFSGRMVNGGTDPVTPALTDVNKLYGLLKTGAGEWVVDQTETTTTSVMIVDVDIDNKIVFFKFKEAVLANP